MKPEDEFILDFMPILRKYLSSRSITDLDEQINRIEDRLKTLKSSDSVISLQEEESSQGEVGDGVELDISILDLQEDVQQYIAKAMGYKTVEELLAARPDLEAPIQTLTIT